LAVLVYLVAHAGHLVTKAALLEAVWPDAVVTEGVLKTCLGQLRQVLGEQAKTPRYIATVHRQGYRFIAPVTVIEQVPAADIALSQKPMAFAKQPQAPGSVSHAPRLIVGREAELAQLHQCWARALKGERQVVVITGETGIGKTAIVDTFAAQVVGLEPLWIGRGQCIEHYGAGEAYLPLLEALGRLCRGPDGDRLFDLLHHHAPSGLMQLPGLVSTTEFADLQQRVSGTTRERMLRELVEAMEVLTAERPLLLILEDLHWSDSATLEWLMYVARRLDWARLLVLGTYRPEDAMVQAHPVRSVVQELQRHGRGVELALSYLPETGVAAYLAQRFGEGTLPDELARVLCRRTDGNPLFLVMVVDELVRQGTLREGAAGWEMAEGLETAVRGVPESLCHLIEEQLEQLPCTDRELLEAASVAGVEFSATAVAVSVGNVEEAVEARCDALARRGQFLRSLSATEWPDGTVSAQYAFRHTFFQEILYERVSVSRRVRWHRQIGARLERGYGPQARELAAKLAKHFMHGREPWRAVQYLQYAGENALRRSAHQEAIPYLLQGLTLLSSLPETSERAQQELALLITLGALLGDLKGPATPEVARVYARAWELCQQVGETPQRIPVLLGLATSHTVGGQVQKAHGLAEQALHLARCLQDTMHLAYAQAVLGNSLFFLGKLDVAQMQLEQSLALYNPQQHRAGSFLGGEDLHVFCFSHLATILWDLGYPDQALQRGYEALMLARELAHPFSLAVALISLAILHQRRREEHMTHELAEAAVVLSNDHGFALCLAEATSLWGWALVVQGQAEVGIKQIQRSLAIARTTGAEARQPYKLALLAEAYRQVGQTVAGEQALVEALRFVDANGVHPWEAELHRLRGEFLLARTDDQLSAAETCFQHALDVAYHRQAKSLALRAAMSLSRLWQRQGKRGEARQLLAQIDGWFTEGFDTADLQEAKVLLEELS
jgi:DNA-binding winged helix-turn-helix (wHTH) protein/predicted ATPase